jgi:O-6-methylguanine DNA methyltransferase
VVDSASTSDAGIAGPARGGLVGQGAVLVPKATVRECLQHTTVAPTDPVDPTHEPLSRSLGTVPDRKCRWTASEYPVASPVLMIAVPLHPPSSAALLQGPSRATPPGAIARPAEDDAVHSVCSLVFARAETVLGGLLLAAADRRLCFLEFGESEEALLRQLRMDFPAATLQRAAGGQVPQFSEWVRNMQRYLAGQTRTLDLPFVLHGTAFQRRVWRCLQSIPPGEVRSYRDVAEELGQPKSARAVASACARNRLAILVPCHRVVRGDGGLSGFRWGIDRKRKLLAIEGARPEFLMARG